MLDILKQILAVGIVSEQPPAAEGEARVREELHAELRRILGRALCIRQVDAGSCNGCELEIHALNNPYYNIEGDRAEVRREPAPRRHAAGHRTGVAAHGGGAAPHLRRDAGPEAGGRGRGLRRLRRHLRRELRQLRARGERDSRSTSKCAAARRRPPRSLPASSARYASRGSAFMPTCALGTAQCGSAFMPTRAWRVRHCRTLVGLKPDLQAEPTGGPPAPNGTRWRAASARRACRRAARARDAGARA